MNDHAECMKEAAFLRQSLEDARASSQNFQKQLATKSAGMSFALKAGENAARKADYEIAKLNEIISSLMVVITDLTVTNTKEENIELMKKYPILDSRNLR